MKRELTAIRLDLQTRNRINAMPLISGKKNFSDTLRMLIGMGLNSFEANIGSLNANASTNIRYIAQKTELGDLLSPTEISHIFYSITSGLYHHRIPHLNLVKTICAIFTEAIENQAFIESKQTRAIFAEQKFLIHEDGFDSDASSFFDLIKSSPPFSRIKNFTQKPEPALAMKVITLDMECVLDALSALMALEWKFIKDKTGFYNLLKPYLPQLVAAAKRCQGPCENSVPVHYVFNNEEIKNHNLEKTVTLHEKNYGFYLIFSQIHAVSIFMMFKEKDFGAHLTFYEMDDILKAVHYASSIPKQEPESVFENWQHIQTQSASLYLNFQNEGHYAELRKRGISIYFTEPQWKDFIDFCAKIEHEHSKHITFFRNQHGSF
jgi:hypothetical protein